MSRPLCFLGCLVLLIASAPLLVAQTQSSTPASPHERPAASTGALVTRVPPPSPAASVRDLEQTADQLNEQKDFLDSVDYYREALKKTNTAKLHLKLGIPLLMLKRDKEAAKEFEKAIKLDKKMAVAYNNLGAVAYDQQNYGKAIKEYKKAIRLQENNATFHSNLGAAYFSRNDYRNAAQEYSRTLQLDPTIFDHITPGGLSIRPVSSADLGHFHYVIAQTFGLRGDLPHCRLFLSKANEEGYPFVRNALKDNNFASLRKDPDFVAFVKSLKPPPALPASSD